MKKYILLDLQEVTKQLQPKNINREVIRQYIIIKIMEENKGSD